MAATFRLDHGGMRALLRSPGVRADLQRRAESVASAARAAAPVQSGAYRNSIHVQSDTTDRAVARVVATVPYAVEVEFDTRTLGRALDGAR
jgi:hypothetical protein